jgi:hypothetical protein
LRAQLLLTLAFLTACSDNLPSPSLVSTLRILAVRSEPPENYASGTVVLDALVARPPTATDPVEYLWLGCPAGLADADCTGAAAQLVALPPPCGASTPSPQVCTLGQAPGAQAAVSATVHYALVVATTASGGVLGCLGRIRHGALPGDACVMAVKTVNVVSAGVPLNHNPRVTSFTAGGADVAVTPPVVVPQDRKVALAPVYDSNAASETKPDGTREVLTFSWFATAGAFDFFHSGYAPPPQPAEHDGNNFSAAGLATQDIAMWLTLRDDRGGVSWTVARVHTEAP